MKHGKILFFILMIISLNFFHKLAYAEIAYDLKKPNLSDIFNGKARFQTIRESEEVKLYFNVNEGKNQTIWDQKIPILFDNTTGSYYTFTRGFVDSTKKFKIVALVSNDGVNFFQKGILFENLYSNPGDNWSLYDAHINFTGDNYIMTLECANQNHGASLCISETKTPFVLSSWSQPQLIIENSRSANKSASTGVSVNFNGHNYLSWTVVNDSKMPFFSVKNNSVLLNNDDGDESTFSKGIKIRKNIDKNYFKAGKSADIGNVLINTQSNPYCSTSWDCNNVDVQDWKIHENKFYAIYNGSNYYRCSRPNVDSNYTNKWGIAIRRSDHPLGDYSESSGILIQSSVNDICGISYPILNTIAGEIYLYYSYYSYDSNGRRINKTMRSKLLNDPPLQITLQTAKLKNFGLVVDNSKIFVSDKIENLYVTFLNRYPKNEESKYYINCSIQKGYEHVVRSVFLSGEHKKIWASRNTRQKIISLYQGFFNRKPDVANYSNLENLILTERRSLESIFNVLIKSTEFIYISNQVDADTIKFDLESSTLGACG